MGKAAAKPKTTTPAQGELEQLIDASAKSNAGTQIVASLLGMSWRLAMAILVPLLVGVQLDARLDSKPAYTLSSIITDATARVPFKSAVNGRSNGFSSIVIASPTPGTSPSQLVIAMKKNALTK